MKHREQPMCCICGRRHRVSAYAQTWSPYHNACASCATALRGLLQWAAAHDGPPIEQLLTRFTELKRIQSEQRAKLAQTA